MSVDEPDGRPAAPSPSQIRRRAYAAVRAVLSEGHNYERAVKAARAVTKAALAEFGADGLAAIAVELSLELSSALEWLAVDQEIAAVDLADVCFVDRHADLCRMRHKSAYAEHRIMPRLARLPSPAGVAGPGWAA